MTSTTIQHSGFRASARLSLAALALATLSVWALPAMAQPMGGMQGGPGLHGDMHGGPHGMRGGMAGGRQGGMGHMSERVLNDVKATPEQRAQIKQIMESARKDLQAQREGGRALREEGMRLFSQANVDANAVEALRQRRLAQHDQASKRMTQAMLEASRVLTPEQRQQLAQRMQQRQQMMQRHRQER